MSLHDHTATIRLDPHAPRGGSHILFITRANAKTLHAKGLLQKIDGRAEYCAPRSWRQIIHKQAQPLSPAVLTHCYLTPKEAINAAHQHEH